MRQIGVVPKLSSTPGRVRTRGPAFGEHTEAILRDLGLSDDEIASYRTRRIVG
jgi:formyl-CoA transferase